MGERPINSMEEGHPMLAAAVRVLNVASYREQAKAWWFNTELTQLTPDAGDGFIYLPNDVIRVDPCDQGLNYVQRGRRLYKAYASDAEDKYVFDKPVTCWLVRGLPFTDLPVPAQLVVQYATLIDFQKDFDGDNSKYEKLAASYREASIYLSAEHIRNKGANFLARNSTFQKIAALSPRTNRLATF